MADKTKYVAWWDNGKKSDDPDFENGIERVSGYTKEEAKETAKKQVGYKYGWSTVTINRINKVE